MDEQKEIKLKEYQMAQQSAEHHDSIIWTASSIFTASSLIMLGAVGSYFYNIPCLILVLISMIGTLMCALNFFLIIDFAKIKNARYEECKKLKKELKIKLCPLNSGGSGIQRELYCSFLAIMMSVWIMLIILKCCC